MTSGVVLCALLGIGYLLRVRIELLRRLHLPSSVVAGIVGLVLIQVLQYTDLASPVISGSVTDWKHLPEILVNVVFACFFLGTSPPTIAELKCSIGVQILYGQILAWGQYAIAIAIWVLAISVFFPQFPAMFAGILPIGFAGGHGTAAGMGPVFEYYGWPVGREFGLTSATFGILSGLVIGFAMIGRAIRRGWLVRRDGCASSSSHPTGMIPVDNRPAGGKLTVSSDVVETLSLHIVLIGAAVGIGYAIKLFLVTLESTIPLLFEYRVLSGFPLFPLCMIGGLVVQVIDMRIDTHQLIDAGFIRRIQNTAVDFLVVSAIATIEFRIIVQGLIPLLVLVVAGISWNVLCLLLLAPRVFKDAWFERAIVEMGQAMGVTATGLLLLRVVDPSYKTPAATAFAGKQVVHILFIGWTSAAIPLLARGDPLLILVLSSCVVLVCLGGALAVHGTCWPHKP